VVITGAASGMGAETLTLLVAAGATVVAVDVAEVATSASVRHVSCDLAEPASIDAAVDRLPETVDVLMNCAGVPNGGRFSPPEVMRVNWLGLRHLTEVVLDRMPEGGSVVHIASTAGRAWTDRIDEHRQLMAAERFQDGLDWVLDHPEVIGDGYAFSKEAVQYYTMWRAVQLLPRGLRMNSICPGITDTGIIGDFRKGMGDELIDHAERVAGRMAHPAEMAPAMLFLADPMAASYINGVNLNIDRGTGAARLTGQSDPAYIWR
jgi:NAD(P)-dependent dehydrogenase (short-subunit alcohol dehydrogenase family)